MFLDFDSQSPLVFTFSKQFEHLNRKFRENLYGGLVNVYTRDVTTQNPSHLPINARFTPNGSKISSIVALDFTSMPRIIKDFFNCLSLKTFENSNDSIYMCNECKYPLHPVFIGKKWKMVYSKRK